MSDPTLKDFVNRTRGTPVGEWGRMLDRMGTPPPPEKPGRGYPEIWKVLGIGIFLAWLMWPSQGPTTRTAPPERRPPTQPPSAQPRQPEGGKTAARSNQVTPAPLESQGAPTVLPLAPPAPLLRPVVFSATHKHRMRDCEGILTLSAEAIRFQTDHPEDSFVYGIDQVELHEDGVKDSHGKAWHFKVEGRDVRDMLRLWKAGALLEQSRTH